MSVFYGRAPFLGNGCYGVKYGQLSLPDPFSFQHNTKKLKCDKAVSRSHLNADTFSKALTGKKTKGVLIVVFVGVKPYIGTANRRKQSIRYPMRAKKSATSEALPMWHFLMYYFV